MDRYLILRHLGQARQHQAIGKMHLARQLVSEVFNCLDLCQRQGAKFLECTPDR
jgi:hypothetical protein